MLTSPLLPQWLYEDGRSLDAKAYQVHCHLLERNDSACPVLTVRGVPPQAKTKELGGLTSPIFLRHSELVARPKAAMQVCSDALSHAD